MSTCTCTFTVVVTTCGRPIHTVGNASGTIAGVEAAS